jgi:isopropylmalate/homocitrate/citramalate synthase
MLDRSKVWAGDLNRRALEPQPHVTVGLYDTTLRDGEQTVGVVLSPEDKVAIAKALDDAGIDRIEAGFPRVSAEDAEAIRLIMQEDLQAEVWGFARAVPADIEALAELGVRAAVVESPISDGKLAALGVSRDAMLGRIRTAVAAAAEAGVKVAYFGVDGTRADLGFARQAYEAAVEAGAREVVVVDTLGVATPEAAAFFVGSVVEWLGDERPVHWHGHDDFGLATAAAVAAEIAVVDTIGVATPEAAARLVGQARGWVGEAVPVHWHGHDDFGLATAAAVAAVQAGATWVQGTVNGMGERGGNANLLEVALALEALYGIPTRLRLDRARALGRLVADTAGTPLEPWKPVTGENLFTRESGAVAAQFHDPPAIEPYAGELIGAERGIVLGKKSGLDSIRIKAEQLGLDITEADKAELLAKVKALGVKKSGLVTDAEFKRLVRGGSRVSPS